MPKRAVVSTHLLNSKRKKCQQQFWLLTSADDKQKTEEASEFQQPQIPKPEVKTRRAFQQLGKATKQFLQGPTAVLCRPYLLAPKFIITLKPSSRPVRTLRTQNKSFHRTPQAISLFLSFILKVMKTSEKKTRKMSKTSITVTIIVMEKKLLLASAHSQQKACPLLGRRYTSAPIYISQLYQTLTEQATSPIS